MRWILALLAFTAAAVVAYFLIAPPAPQASAPRAALATIKPVPAIPVRVTPEPAQPTPATAPETPPAPLPQASSRAWKRPSASNSPPR